MTGTIIPDVSVVICAYAMQRWDQLVAAVESLRAQTVLPREVVVVVDHNPELFERVRNGLPDVIALENREQRGLSGARNSGIAVAKGAHIAFLDDDAVAMPDWLSWLTGYDDDDRVLGVGGAADPIWASGRPRWLPEEFYWTIGCSYRGLPEDTGQVRNPFGGCMCLRREIFEAVGGFRTGVGRVETRPVGCEETELCIRARQHWPQRIFLYEPRARILHHVPDKRSRWAYFCSRCYAEGTSKAVVSKFVGMGDGLSAERAYVLSTLPRGVLRGIADAVKRGDWYGLGRAGAIVAGLAFTTAGYVAGTISEHLSALKNRLRHASGKVNHGPANTSP